ncbi:prephenate dehydrogenase/arogenate dehydrogenase family protein [Streptomyces sp. ICN441]|uniref:Prephenate dehydrogenase/arogenate dehydrogenase family protein n=1 Tax=Streptomyces tirandamycinicus TaxID=2174846 RepID=A0A2S1T2D9_9ACTN|nr:MULTISPECIES: prephenate dehydrogenase/arogenate dehydrogenase family protein [Streptomyces]AWI32822.1 prephenate dehydrogenase/arogenate dehydrogenase family protein [Streptomyces tirandamycinicus]TFE38861.1 prephenate dehydrogenase/arogenate dehydrogenase family protein [Streptomyces sp. ICN441]
MTATTLRTALVIGCGTAGTSVALALTGAGVDVALLDEDPQALAEAVALGAGTGWTPRRPPAGIVVIATPPSAVVDVLHQAQSRGLGHVYTDTAGTKEIICAEAELRGCDLKGYVPGHPLAGPDAPGRAAADAGRFTGRPWVLCPYETTPGWALETAAALIGLCGARRLDLEPHVHDRVAAELSHGPHLVAAALATRFARSSTALLGLADDALRDAVRPAGGDPWPWGDVLAHNAGPVADVLDRLAGQLTRAAAVLREGAGSAPLELAVLLEQGRQGQAALEEARELRTPRDARTGDRV